MQTKLQKIILMIIVIFLLILLTIVSLSSGIVNIKWHTFFSELFNPTNTAAHIAIWQLRMPRVLLAIVGGALFSGSGLLLQAVIRNPLAAPSVVGITPGAGLAVIIVVLLLPNAPASLVAWSGTIGAVGGFAMVWFLSRDSNGVDPQLLALIGITLGAFFLAVHHLVLINSLEGSAASPLAFLAGSVYSAKWAQVKQLYPGALILIPMALLLHRKLDVLLLGDTFSTTLGLSLRRFQMLVLWLATAMAGLAVTAVGVLAFVGLVAPHMARRLVGLHHKWSLPMACLLGALLVLTADFIGRTVFAPYEIPAGIITALMGAPYFLGLLFYQRRAYL